MKKLYDKDPVWFAVFWIVLYVAGFANADSLSERLGIPKLLTVILGLAMTLVLYLFLGRHGLTAHFGLCIPRGKAGRFLYFIPLILISCVNLRGGLELRQSLPEALLAVVSMCFVGFLEELIFRGFLFKGMCASHVTTAIVVSSLTFGMGHAVNLLLGAPVSETLLQLVYASAIGFCYTALFHVSGSILPCILSHALVNSTSVFAVDADGSGQIFAACIQTVLSILYGLWLLRRPRPQNSAAR